MTVFFAEDFHPELLDVALEKRYINELARYTKTESRFLEIRCESDSDGQMMRKQAASINALNSVAEYLERVSDRLTSDDDYKHSVSLKDLESSIQQILSEPFEHEYPGEPLSTDEQETQARLARIKMSEVKSAFSALLAIQENEQEAFLNRIKLEAERYTEALINDFPPEELAGNEQLKDSIAEALLRQNDNNARMLPILERQGSLLYPIWKQACKEQNVATTDALAGLFDIDLEGPRGFETYGARIDSIRQSKGMKAAVQVG